MARLRAKFWVALFFGLISLGQAYPYSYAWAEGRHAECGCNGAGRKCIHGCDLRKKTKAASQVEHAAMSQGGHHGQPASAPGSAALQSHENKARPLWVSPDCSEQKKREVLDFRGDPFVPQSVVFFLPSRLLEWKGEAGKQPPQRSFLPDPPPPKSSSVFLG